jgi:hypothetical protein
MLTVLSWVVGRLGAWLWPVVGVFALGMVATIGWLNYRVEDLKEDLSLQGAKFTEARLLASKASAAQEARFRADEQAVRNDQQEKLDEAEKQITQARADRVIADAAAGRLQQRFAAALAAAREAARSPAPAGSGTTAPTGDLPADMFGRVLEVARQYRDAAETALTAGELAERDYDALRARSLLLAVP